MNPFLETAVAMFVGVILIVVMTFTLKRQWKHEKVAKYKMFAWVLLLPIVMLLGGGLMLGIVNSNISDDQSFLAGGASFTETHRLDGQGASTMVSSITLQRDDGVSRELFVPSNTDSLMGKFLLSKPEGTVISHEEIEEVLAGHAGN